MHQLKRLAALACLVTLIACGGPSAPPPPPSPSASAVTPTVADHGDAIAVTGTGFGTSGTLTVGGAEATVTDWSDTRIEATVPAGAGDAWQEVVVTNEVGTSSVDGFFVGVEFDGAAAELQEFLDGLELGSSVLLAADDYDLSASTEPFVVDNKSLYGRGSDQTTIQMPTATGGILLSEFGATLTVADLSLVIDDLMVLAGTFSDTTTPFLVAPGAPAARLGLGELADQLARADAELTPAATGPAGVLLDGVSMTESTGGGTFGLVPLFVPAVDLTLRDVVMDAPTLNLTYATTGDIVLDGATVTVGQGFLISVGGQVSVIDSEVTSEGSIELGADTGLTIEGSTVTAKDGDVTITGAMTSLEIGSAIPTGGPVEITTSSLSALDADLTDADAVGNLVIRTQLAKVTLRDNEVIRAHGDLVVRTELSYLGEGDIDIVGNDVRVGVFKAEDAVNFRSALFEVAARSMGPAQPRVSLADNQVAASAVLFVHSDGTVADVHATGNSFSVGDAGVVGNLLIAPSIGALELRDNVFTETGATQLMAADLDGGTFVLSGNTFVNELESLAILLAIGVNGSCEVEDNTVVFVDPSEVTQQFVQVACDGAATPEALHTITGNELTLTGAASSGSQLTSLAGEASVSGNDVLSSGQVGLAAGGVASFTDNTFEGLMVQLDGSGSTVATFSGNKVTQASPVYGLGLGSLGEVTVTENSFTATGTPAADAHALRVSATGNATKLVVTDNTFTGYARALRFTDVAGAANGIDAQINDNVFDFTIDAAPKVAELVNVADEIDATSNRWGNNAVLATVEGYVTLSGDTNVQGGSILLNPIVAP